MSRDTTSTRTRAAILACCAALALTACAAGTPPERSGPEPGAAQMPGDDLRGPLSPGYKWGS